MEKNFDYYMDKYNLIVGLADEYKNPKRNDPTNWAYRFNPKDKDKGEIVYFVFKEGTEMRICFGKVYEHYSDAIVIETYDFRECRMIDDIPYNEVPNIGRWHKLPKNWSHNTLLYQRSNDLCSMEKELYDDCCNNFADKSVLQNAIDLGFLVPSETIDYSHIDVEVDPNKGYRLVKKCSEPSSYYESILYNGYATINHNKVFREYDEAKAYVDKYEQGLKRLSEMSDHEYIFREILDKVSLHIAKQYPVLPPEDMFRSSVRPYMDFLLKQDNFEDIIVCEVNKQLQWKYSEKKKWAVIGNL